MLLGLFTRTRTKKYIGLHNRLSTVCVDFLLLLLIFIPLGWLSNIFIPTPNITDIQNISAMTLLSNLPVTAMILMQILQIMICLLFYIFFWHKLGSTPGGLFSGYYVVDADTYQQISYKTSDYQSPCRPSSNNLYLGFYLDCI